MTDVALPELEDELALVHPNLRALMLDTPDTDVGDSSAAFAFTTGGGDDPSAPPAEGSFAHGGVVDYLDKVDETAGYRSPLGLSGPQRLAIRAGAVAAAELALHHRPIVYTEGGDRWDGINHHRLAARHEFPHAADCSAFCTWCLWTASRWKHNLGDFVNGQGWKAGYTGTMEVHGQRIERKHLIRADLVLYGTPSHVAIYVGHDRVISHGSPGGPRLLRVDYRSDIHSFRRYVR